MAEPAVEDVQTEPAEAVEAAAAALDLDTTIPSAQDPAALPGEPVALAEVIEVDTLAAVEAPATPGGPDDTLPAAEPAGPQVPDVAPLTQEPAAAGVQVAPAPVPSAETTMLFEPNYLNLPPVESIPVPAEEPSLPPVDLLPVAQPPVDLPPAELPADLPAVDVPAAESLAVPAVDASDVVETHPQGEGVAALPVIPEFGPFPPVPAGPAPVPGPEPVPAPPPPPIDLDPLSVPELPAIPEFPAAPELPHVPVPSAETTGPLPPLDLAEDEPVPVAVAEPAPLAEVGPPPSAVAAVRYSRPPTAGQPGLGPLPGLMRAPDSLQISWPHQEARAAVEVPPEPGYPASPDLQATLTPHVTPQAVPAAPLTPPTPVAGKPVERVSLGVKTPSFDSDEDQAWPQPAALAPPAPAEDLETEPPAPAPAWPPTAAAEPAWEDVVPNPGILGQEESFEAVAAAPPPATQPQAGPQSGATSGPGAGAPVMALPTAAAPAPATPALTPPAPSAEPTTTKAEPVARPAAPQKAAPAHNPWLGLLWWVAGIFLVVAFGLQVGADLDYVVLDDTVAPRLLDCLEAVGRMALVGALVTTAIDWRLKRR
ncbi:MAG: hypothetical protein LBR19_02640 [Bifidobacteriaceae bacterium]|nr:hypothetical protein [Bifidobacteriaceae bacterium]